jgi:hypothetical protein
MHWSLTEQAHEVLGQSPSRTAWSCKALQRLLGRGKPSCSSVFTFQPDWTAGVQGIQPIQWPVSFLCATSCNVLMKREKIIDYFKVLSDWLRRVTCTVTIGERYTLNSQSGWTLSCNTSCQVLPCSGTFFSRLPVLPSSSVQASDIKVHCEDHSQLMSMWQTMYPIWPNIIFTWVCEGSKICRARSQLVHERCVSNTAPAALYVG